MSAPVTIGQYVTAKAPTKAQQAEKAYHAVCAALLDLHWHIDDAKPTAAKIARIVERMDRMDDVYPLGTPERDEAEVVVATLKRSVKRHKDAARKAARRVTEKWPELTPAYERILLVEILPGWSDDPALDVVRLDPILGRDPVWARLLAAASGDGDPANDQPCPF